MPVTLYGNNIQGDALQQELSGTSDVKTVTTRNERHLGYLPDSITMIKKQGLCQHPERGTMPKGK